MVRIRQTGGHQLTHQLLAGLPGGPDEEEIVGFPAVFRHLPADNAMGIGNDSALGCLPENFRQANGRHHAGADHFPQNVAGANAGQLVRVSHHDNAAAMLQGAQQALKQLDVHHTHLVQNDDVTLEQVLFIVNKAHRPLAVIHFQ